MSIDMQPTEGATESAAKEVVERHFLDISGDEVDPDVFQGLDGDMDLTSVSSDPQVGHPMELDELKRWFQLVADFKADWLAQDEAQASSDVQPSQAS